MRPEEPRPVRLAEYRPPDWLVEKVELNVVLQATATRVQSLLHLRPNPAAQAPAPIVLDGDGLRLVSLKLDGAMLDADNYVATADRLSIPQPPPGPCRLEIETEINPSANTQLMGLYRSNGTYCTQCEAEGFRRITYFPDRPDVMALFTTRIEAEQSEAPVLLANGNLIASGSVPGTSRHFAVWHDPFPKPSYLFALVGGDLASVEDRFITMSGREVTLRIHVEHGKQDRCAYAMDALKRSMAWDERAFGREYDLDIFMIVAVSDFNMGAMENKGLNVFNDKYVLASPDTATDGDFASIEAIIAHEYFHNWTGNRITCRDWFQLCLKEGLTVFRDQEFTSEERSRSVKRIADVRVLRSHQFVEDAGPLAHPVRPSVYHEINNFYTATVYEKAAEVVRMIKTLLGPEAFRAGMDLYFQRHDGEAATIEQFVQCFADVSGRDFTQFMRWYFQAGTPRVTVSGRYDGETCTYRLDVEQTTPPTPGQPDKEPMVIPLALGLVGSDGNDMPLVAEGGDAITRGVVVVTEPTQSFVFKDVPTRPVLSLNRGFSAPINLRQDLPAQELGFLAAHDPDPFNRWQAVQSLAIALLVENVGALRSRATPRLDPELITALGSILSDDRLEPAFVSQALALPSEADIAREIGQDVDPDAIFIARTDLRRTIGSELSEALRKRFAAMQDSGPYSPDAVNVGRRSLKNACLDLLTAADPGMTRQVMDAYGRADNMTDRVATLSILSLYDCPERTEALDDFYRRYSDNPLIVDKWFALQASIPEAATLDRVKMLTQHPAFSYSNPNRVRSLIGAFAQGNQTQFNRQDGRGYAFVIDTALTLDARNPQVAARLMSSFKSWRALERLRRDHAELALRRAQETPDLSRDVADIVTRALAKG